MAQSKGHFVIVANGEIRFNRDFRSRLALAEKVIVCDGAADRLLSHDIIPDFVIGDGDSLSPASRKRLGRRFIKDPDQETNDLDKAFRLAVSKGAVSVSILGGGGRREDHTIGNAFRLMDYQGLVPGDVSMVTPYGVFSPVLSLKRFLCRPNDGVSVFAPERGTRVYSEGLKWPLVGQKFPALYSATLNRAVGDEFTIKTNKPVLVFAER